MKVQTEVQKSQIQNEVVVAKDKTKHAKTGNSYRKYRFLVFVLRDSDSNVLALVTVPSFKRKRLPLEILASKRVLKILSKHYLQFSNTYAEKRSIRNERRMKTVQARR